MKLKVCGMRSSKNIINLAKIMPDYMGFIFWENSKRFVSNSTPFLGERVKKVGVFVNATLEYIKECVEAHKLNAVQLHGNESPKQCGELGEVDVEVIKAFAVQRDFDFNEIDVFMPWGSLSLGYPYSLAPGCDWDLSYFVNTGKRRN